MEFLFPQQTANEGEKLFEPMNEHRKALEFMLLLFIKALEQRIPSGKQMRIFVQILHFLFYFLCELGTH